MAREGELIVRGFKEFLRACDHAPKEAKREVRQILREAGSVVRRDATDRFDAYSTKSAHGYRVVVRSRGVAVEQSLRKTTGRNPQWGALQMRRALLPALHENTARFEREMEHAVDLIADVFEYGSY
jgi:hypothetical protein